MVPRSHELGSFVDHQRQRYSKNNKLKGSPFPKKAMDMLTSIGFLWKVRYTKEEWNANFRTLLKLKQEQADICEKKDDWDQEFRDWFMLQMTNIDCPSTRSMSCFYQRHLKLLVLDAGILDNLDDKQWNIQMKRVANFMEANGRHPSKNMNDDDKLCSWVEMQKIRVWDSSFARRNRLSRLKKMKLFGLNFSGDDLEEEQSEERTTSVTENGETLNDFHVLFCFDKYFCNILNFL